MAKRTYKQANEEIMKHLRALGWEFSAPDLKVPHATNPAGTLRFWFKPQSIHYTYGSPASVRAFGEALSVIPFWDYRDTNTYEVLANLLELDRALRRK